MELALRERIALVTGASEGIGRITAQALAADGVQLTPCARREAPLRHDAGPEQIAAAASCVTTGTPLQVDGGLARCI